MSIDPLFSDEEKLVRRTMRDFVEQRVVPIIEEHNRNCTFPTIKEMGQLGILGATLQGYGCAGLNYVSYSGDREDV